MADRINIEELKSKLEEIFESESSSYGFEFTDFLLGDFNQELGDKADLKWLEQDGGGEGGAESCYTVFSIGDITYKITYTYYSHHGFETSYAAAYTVTPTEKTVIVYS
ncbi:hypothetical protein D3C87_325300 [compost metagenome]